MPQNSINSLTAMLTGRSAQTPSQAPTTAAASVTPPANVASLIAAQRIALNTPGQGQVAAEANAGGFFNYGGMGASVPPFSPYDSSVLVDIGIPLAAGNVQPRNTWTNLPYGFALSGADASTNVSANGFIPGVGGTTSAAMISASNVLPASFGAQGTIYMRVARQGLALDQSLSSSSAWYDSSGNTAASEIGGVLWAIANSSYSNYGTFQTSRANGGVGFIPNTFSQKMLATILNPQQPLYSSPYFNSALADVVFTWEPVSGGTQCYIYIDGIPVYDAVISPAISAGDFYTIAIGNWTTGYNSGIGGNLGPYLITRFQVSTAFCPPPILPRLVGIRGDSYCAGGGANGSAGIPGTATLPLSVAAQTMLAVGPRSVLSTNEFFQNGQGNAGQFAWTQLLESYAYKNLGAYFPVYSGSCSGYSCAYSNGYPTCMDSLQQVVVEGYISGTNLVLTSVPSTLGVVTGMQVVSSNGASAQVSAGTIITGLNGNLGGAGTYIINNSQTVGSSGSPVSFTLLGSTTYLDALCAAQPQIVIFWQSINDGIEIPTAVLNAHGSPVSVQPDYLAQLEYLAANNPKLRYIIMIERCSLENFPVGSPSIGIMSPTQWKKVTATWRAADRATFNQAQPYLANGNVPVLYVPLYETCDGAADGDLLHWGINPNNTITTGGQQGPSGSSPDVHPTPQFDIRVADQVFPILKACIESIQWGDRGQVFYAGLTGTTPVPNLVQGLQQVWTMNGNLTVQTPINPPSPGCRVTLEFIQDYTAGRTLAWASSFINAPSLAGGSATAGERVLTEWRYLSNGTYMYIGGSTAFA